MVSLLSYDSDYMKKHSRASLVEKFHAIDITFLLLSLPKVEI
jgi:hypothetical protein